MEAAYDSTFLLLRADVHLLLRPGGRGNDLAALVVEDSEEEMGTGDQQKQNYVATVEVVLLGEFRPPCGPMLVPAGSLE